MEEHVCLACILYNILIFFLTLKSSQRLFNNTPTLRTPSYHYSIHSKEWKTRVRIPAARISNFVQGGSTQRERIHRAHLLAAEAASRSSYRSSTQFPGAGAGAVGSITILSVRRSVPDSKSQVFVAISLNLARVSGFAIAPSPGDHRWIYHIVTE